MLSFVVYHRTSQTLLFGILRDRFSKVKSFKTAWNSFVIGCDSICDCRGKGYFSYVVGTKGSPIAAPFPAHFAFSLSPVVEKNERYETIFQPSSLAASAHATEQSGRGFSAVQNQFSPDPTSQYLHLSTFLKQFRLGTSECGARAFWMQTFTHHIRSRRSITSR